MRKMENSALLIVDADQSWTSLLSAKLSKHGYVVTIANGEAEAVELARRQDFPVMLIDPALGPSLGLEAVRRIRAAAPESRCIILASRPTAESMMEAVRDHMFDYLCKPIDLATLENALRRAAEDYQQHVAAAPVTAELRLADYPPRLPWDELAQEERRAREPQTVLVGESKAISLVRQQIAEVTPTNMTVLIRGESGTGKGVVARMIHEQSQRGAKGALVKINCPAIPETLLESELFGHEAGAFTDAKGRKPGRFELAHSGTIFLDEIGEIPPNIQVKLLQVIEHKEFQRIGGSSTIHVDARILAATNASLEQMIDAGNFRADLFYRLNEYCINLPPLRERVEDIPLLVQHFLRLYGQEFGRSGLSLSAESMALLMRCPWYGNVRELESVIRRFALTGREDSIRPLLHPPASGRGPAARRESDTLRQSEIQAIMSALTEARWNQRRAAVILGISYSALRRRIEKFGLKVSATSRPNPTTPLGQECRF
jgi:DNA-binding NtrC family response regulator